MTVMHARLLANLDKNVPVQKLAIDVSFRSVVVITFASHAKGPQFEPGRKQIIFLLFYADNYIMLRTMIAKIETNEKVSAVSCAKSLPICISTLQLILAHHHYVIIKYLVLHSVIFMFIPTLFTLTLSHLIVVVLLCQLAHHTYLDRPTATYVFKMFNICNGTNSLLSHSHQSMCHIVILVLFKFISFVFQFTWNLEAGLEQEAQVTEFSKLKIHMYRNFIR